MLQPHRIHDVPPSPREGDLWSKPAPSRLDAARMALAETALRLLGFGQEARQMRNRRFDHLGQFRFTGLVWQRRAVSGHEFITADGCGMGFNLDPEAIARIAA